MEEKLKKNLSCLLCAWVGILCLIFCFTPYIMIDDYETSWKITCEDIMMVSWWSTTVIPAFVFQCLSLLASVLLIVWAILFNLLPEKLSRETKENVSKYSLVIVAILNVSLLLCLIMFMTEEFGGRSFTKARMGAGPILLALFSVGAAVVNFVFNKGPFDECIAESEPAESTVSQPVVAQRPIVSQPVATIEGAPSIFTGGLLGLIGITLLQILLVAVTLGIGATWAECMKQRWYKKHTFINGKQLVFVGTGGQLLLACLKWVGLIIITIGIYTFWLPVKVEQWMVEHTHFVQN